MTTSASAERDLDAELAEPEAGEFGHPVDARCTDCKRVRAKLATDRDGPEDTTSFKHWCSRCRKVRWWNVLRVLPRDPVEPEEVGR
jgi:ribosomal protein L36